VNGNKGKASKARQDAAQVLRAFAVQFKSQD
jgi:hypothetical protein